MIKDLSILIGTLASVIALLTLAKLSHQMDEISSQVENMRDLNMAMDKIYRDFRDRLEVKVNNILDRLPPPQAKTKTSTGRVRSSPPRIWRSGRFLCPVSCKLGKAWREQNEENYRIIATWCLACDSVEGIS